MARPAYSQGLAVAGVWYAAILLLNLNTGLARAAVIGAVPWLLTAAALTYVPEFKTWQKVLLALPIFYFLWEIAVAFLHGSFPL